MNGLPGIELAFTLLDLFMTCDLRVRLWWILHATGQAHGTAGTADLARYACSSAPPQHTASAVGKRSVREAKRREPGVQSAAGPAGHARQETRWFSRVTAERSVSRVSFCMGDVERQSRLALNERLVSHPLFDGGCRDPRWATPTTARLEAAWDNANPVWSPRHYVAIGQFKELERPVTSDGQRIARKLAERPRVATPPTHRKKVSPTIFTNSMSWNRRRCMCLPEPCCVWSVLFVVPGLSPAPRLHARAICRSPFGLVASDEPTVVERPSKAAPASSWYSPRSARSSHSARRRRRPESGCAFPRLMKQADSPIPQPPRKEARSAELEPEPEPEPESAMKPHRKGWILHRQDRHADSRYEAISALQEQMMDKIRSGGITPEDLKEFKKLIAELSSSINR